MELIGYSKCSTCQQVKKELEARGYNFTFRDYTKDVLTKSEIAELYKLSKLEIKKLFNTNGKIYKENNYKDQINTMSIDHALELLAKNPMLIKRPIVKNGDEVFISKKVILDKYL